MTAFTEAFTGTAGAYINTNANISAIGWQWATYQTAPAGMSGTACRFPGTQDKCEFKASIGNPITTGKAYIRAYINVPTGSVMGNGSEFSFLDSQAGGSWVYNGFTVDGTNVLRLHTYTSQAGSTYALSVDTTYRLELDCDYDAHTLAGRIYVGESTTPVYSQSLSWTPGSGALAGKANTNGQADAFGYYLLAGTGTWFTDSLAFSTVAQPGPVGGPPSKSGTGTLAATATFANSPGVGAIVSSGANFAVEAGQPGQMAGVSKYPDNTTPKAGHWEFVSGDFDLVPYLSSSTDPVATFTAPAL